jgi:hypothetical protein
MEDSKAMATPMSVTTTLEADGKGEYVDQKEYRSMIRSLLYLTATRPDIQFSVCLCACFQASPRTSHRQAVKRIFKYLRHTPNFGLLYSASSTLALHGFSDLDFAGCRLDRKSTSTCQFLGSSLVSWSSRNNRVWLNPLPRQSMWPQLVVALNSFGSYTPRVILVWNTPTSQFNVIAPVP